MFEQIVQDARVGRFAGWGWSTVVDENIGVPVIGRAEFDRLHAAAGMDAHWPIGNAGLIHVYGYLLSRVETPYGLKRERWEGGQLARAFGLPAQAFLLADAAAAGETVLQRVTDAVMPHLENSARANGDILVFDDRVATGRGASFRTVILHRAFDAVPAVPAALLYGVHDGERMRAITTFPLASVSPESLSALEQDQPRMRYNAALPLPAPDALPPRSPLSRAGR